MGVRAEDEITVEYEKTPEGVKFKNLYEHPQAEDYEYMMLNLDPENFYQGQDAEFVIGKDDGVIRLYDETSAEAFQNKDSSAALGGAAQKAAQKVSTGDLTKKLSSNASGVAAKGLGKMKNPAVFAATLVGAAVGAVAFVGSAEQTYALMQQPESLTNVVIEGSQKAVAKAVEKAPDLAENMARAYDNNDTMVDLKGTRNRPQPGPKGLFSGLKSFLGRGN